MALKVFITGASSGLGQALAQVYARQGATLGLVARRLPSLQALTHSLPGKHRIHAVDVTDGDALRSAAVAHMHADDCPDIVIANAGVSAGTLGGEKEDLTVFEQIVRTNLIAVAATFQPFIASMKARRRGTLVAIASVAGVRGIPGAGAYSASKAGVISYCESLRLELAPYGIKVVTIAPGWVDTPMTRTNPYRMPFMISAKEFARRAVREIGRGSSYAVIPWQMAIVARVLRVLPNPVYDALFARLPRKPRKLAPPPAPVVRELDDSPNGPPTFSQQTLDFGIDVAADRRANKADVVAGMAPDDMPQGITVWRGRAHWPDQKPK